MNPWTRAAILALGAANFFAAQGALAKTPGTTYCYREICHRVKSIAETVGEIGEPAPVVASYYDVPWRDPFNPSLATSSGETFRALEDDTAASPIYPDGTRLLVYAPESGGAAVVRVNDAGPYWSGRLLDVSRGVAEKLGFLGHGIANVTTIVLSAPTPAEARYEAERTYEPVPGYLGAFRDVSEAHATWLATPEAKAIAARPAPTDEAPVPGRSPVVIIASTEAPSADAASKPKDSAGKSKDSAKKPKAPEARKSRVVLKPVKERRPGLLAAIAKRNIRVAEGEKPKGTR